MGGALEGIRIIDLTTMVSGPLATMMLGDQGAEVIKVEAPGIGDAMRYIGSSRGGMSALFANCNRNKRSVVLDLTEDDGKEALRKLIAGADVFVQNFRPGAIDRLGFGYEDVKAIKPDIVYVSVTGFGETGPYAMRPVYDNVIQGISGIAAAQADVDTGEPDLIRNLVCDKVTALTNSQAITAALFARERGAGGQHVKLSMLDSALHFFFSDGLMNQSLLGDGVAFMPPISGSYIAIETKSGYMSITTVTDDQWHGFCRAVERPDMIEEKKYLTIFDRSMHLDELMNWVKEMLLTRTAKEWSERFVEETVPHSVVNTLEGVFEDPQVIANGSAVTIDHEHMGKMRVPKPPVDFGGTPSTIRLGAPKLGEHTEEILEELPDSVIGR